MAVVRRLPMLLFAIFAVSCGHTPIHGEVPVGVKPVFTAKLWVQDDPALPPRLILDGCARWAPLGVACELVADPDEAHVRFLPDKEPCLPPPGKKPDDSKVILATAYGDGRVVIRVNCMTGYGGGFDEVKFSTVVGHELGHELGIWTHVPHECDDRELKYVLLPDGEKLCGEAVMNPSYDPDVTELTDMDGHAFEARDRVYSIFRPVDLGPPPSRPEIICTYGGSAPPAD